MGMARLFEWPSLLRQIAYWSRYGMNYMPKYI